MTRTPKTDFTVEDVRERVSYLAAVNSSASSARRERDVRILAKHFEEIAGCPPTLKEVHRRFPNCQEATGINPVWVVDAIIKIRTTNTGCTQVAYNRILPVFWGLFESFWYGARHGEPRKAVGWPLGIQDAPDWPYTFTPRQPLTRRTITLVSGG